MFQIIFKIGLTIVIILAFIGVILKTIFNNLLYLSWIDQSNSKLKKTTYYIAKKSTLFISLAIMILIILFLIGVFSGQS